MSVLDIVFIIVAILVLVVFLLDATNDWQAEDLKWLKGQRKDNNDKK